MTEADQELYKNFPLVISERWQNEVRSEVRRIVFTVGLCQVSETVFDTINHEYDKTEQKRAKQKKAKFGNDEKDSDCILHGYIKRLVRLLTLCHFTTTLNLLPGRPLRVRLADEVRQAVPQQAGAPH